MLPESEIMPAAVAVLHQIPWLASGKYEVAPLKDIQSFNNRSLRVKSGNDCYFLRLASENASWLGVIREQEVAAIKEAALAGIAPEICYADSAGNMLTRYVEARHWTRDEARQPENIQRAAQLLRRLHTIPNPPETDSIGARIERLVESARIKNLDLPANVDELLVELRRREALCRQDGRFWSGLCHNDFWLNNFLDDGTNLWLVDWEFAGHGNGLYDLATLSLSAEYDEAQKLALLEAYGAAPEDLPHLEAAGFTVYFFEAAWSLVQHGLRGSEQEMNYLWYSQSRFKMLADL